ncbi:hypothetical protein BUALT_Bualt10G0092200 [Buddleja alternifolia]|uniref:Ionotropic glutamate receptor C-terminal domain-containing protein n=1 Tax=Buddleja alternifolia TaxID=168488 RepID=A0AAV6X5Y3_9LAMI|nr:hypothetical protein BUALT_Bualt10G0092200 [Buddleja alternifolia]
MAATAQITPVRVGTVPDMDDYGEMALNCLSMAISDFYATHNYYKSRLVLINRDSQGDVVEAAAAAQVPIVTFSATSPSLSSIRSPYFVRGTLNDSSQVEAIGAIIQAFGWIEVVSIYEDDEFGEGIIPFLTDALEKVNARVPYRSVISPLATDDQIVAELYKLMTMQTRVFVVHMMTPLGSRLFTKAKELGMMSKELWAHDSATALAMAAEEATLRNATYLNSNVSENSIGPELIQALSSISFKGLAGNFQLVDRQLQTPPYQIVNTIGHGGRVIGYWTKENGLTYDAVAGNVTIVANRSQYVDFTLPFTESDFPGPLWHQVGTIFWFTFSTMVFAHKERVISNLSRVVMIIWLLVVLILTQSYTASLASMLTVQQLHPTVTDVFPIGSPLVPDVSRAILNVTEGEKMVGIEKKCLGEKTKCRDSSNLASSNSLGLESFWGLFMIVAIAAVSAIIIHFIRLIIVSSDSEFTILSKIREVLQKYENRDPNAHTHRINPIQSPSMFSNAYTEEHVNSTVTNARGQVSQRREQETETPSTNRDEQ